MKKITTLLLSCAIALGAYAQIPNPGFETWDSATITTSGVWNTYGNVKRSTDKHTGNYSIRLDNVDPNKDTNFYNGIVSNVDLSNFNGNGVPPGGQPYTQKPDSLEGWFKYNLATGDTASIIFGLKTNGLPLAVSEVFITGNSGGNYVRLAWELNYIFPATPDTMVIIMFSCDPDVGAQGDGYIIVDDLKFFSSGGPNANIKGGGMENWVDKVYREPKDWTTTNSFVSLFGIVPNEFPVSRSTVVASGSYAFEGANIAVPGDEIFPGAALSGDILDAEEPSFEVNQRYTSIRGMYKYEGVDEDSAYISVTMFKDGVIVGRGIFSDSATVSSYTLFSADIVYEGSFLGIPDSATILLSAANPDDVKGIGSRIWVDDLYLSTYKTSVNTIAANVTTTKAYPNPFAGKTTIEFNLSQADNVTIKVYDLAGKEVAIIYNNETTAGSHKVTFNAEGLKAGVYFYEIQTSAGKLTNKLIIE